MDPLSIGASSISVIQLGAQIVHRLKTQWEGKTIALLGLQREVEALSEVLEATRQRLSNGDNKFSPALVKCLHDCESTLKRICDVVENATARPKRKLFMLHSSKSTIQPLCQEVERQRLHIGLLSSTLNTTLPSNPEQLLQYSTTLHAPHIGLQALSSPSASAYDIIFVHGLNGHPKRTWQWTDVPQSREVLWPRDFLGRDIPDARIYTYGYDSRKFGSTERMSVADAARILVAAVILERRNTPFNRPIIWVAHSYGGLIVKSALEHSRRNSDLNNPQGMIFNATIGVVFLATPHRAGTAPAWANTIHNINKITDPLSSDTVAAQLPLVEQGHSLQQASSDFNTLIGDGHILVFSFFEQSVISTQWGPMIISDISTALGHPLERIHYLEGNHLTLCKFQDDSELGYIRIRAALNEIRDDYAMMNQMSLSPQEPRGIQTSPVNALRSNSTATSEFCSTLTSNDDSLNLDQLSLPKQCKRYQRALDVSWMERKVIAPRDLGSCKWILEDTSFRSWLETSRIRFLHLTGPPGCGKTVLADFVVDYLQKVDEHKEVPSPTVKGTDLGTTGTGGGKVIFFFFELKQRIDLSIYDLLQIFISQLLDLNWRLLRFVPPRQLERHRHSRNARWISTTTKDLEELLDILLSMLRDPESQTTYCVVDGLDECDSASIPWVTRLLNQLHNISNVKVLLSSRPLEVMDMSTHNAQDFPDLSGMLAGWLRQRTLESVDIAQTQGFSKDLQHYIKPRLKQLVINRGFSQVSDRIERIFLQRHENGFVWITLLLQHIENLPSMRLVKKFLNEIESKWVDLTTIYCKICDNVQEKWKTVGGFEPSIFKALSFLNYAMRPLKMEDLAIALSLSPTSSSLDDVLDDRPLGLDEYFKSELGHLLRFEQGMVSIINSTFKHFIEKTLLPRYQNCDRSKVHFHMAEACLMLLDLWKNQRRSLAIQEDTHQQSDVPFLEYASLCWVNHLQAAGNQATELNGLLLKLWNSSEKKRIFLDFLDSGSESLPFVLAALNLPYNVIAMDDYLRASGPDLQKLLEYAKRHCSATTIQILQEDAQQRKKIAPIPINTVPEVGLEKLLSAIKWQKPSVVRSLLPSIEIKEERQYNAVLEQAVNIQNVEVVTLVLDHCKIGSFGSSLHLAARNANSEICTLLLSRGADCDAKDGKDRTALYIAAKSGQLQIVKYLVDWRAEPSLPDSKGRRPIHRAAAEGYSDIVHFLFKIEPHFGKPDKQGCTPLHAACKAGQVRTTQQLLRYGSDILCTDNDGRTALHAAAIRGVENLVRLLLNSGSDPNWKDKSGRTALHEAALRGWDSVAEVLLLSSAEVNGKDNEGQSPLHYGCRSTSYPENLIRMLLEGGADPWMQDASGRTPLHYAAEFSNAAIVTQLSDLPQTVHIMDKQGNTPLHAAACRPASSRESIMKALYPYLPLTVGQTWIPEAPKWEGQHQIIHNQNV